MSDRHPVKAMIEKQTERKADAGIPVPKYTLVVEITANSRDELSQRIRLLANDWPFRFDSRDSIDSTDGTTSIILEHTSPEQTPEGYDVELQAWSDARRAARSSVLSGGTE